MATSTLAQVSPQGIDYNAHTWSAYSGEHQVNGAWGVHFDAQYRRADLGTEWQQYQIRPALNYRWSPKLQLTAGYAYTRAYPYGDFPVRAGFPEHRIYQQALVNTRAGKFALQQRFRLEQRFIRYPNGSGSFTYQNRFRWLSRVEVPITKGADGQASWYLPIWDEILIGIAPNYGARPFDQNRFFAGVGRSHAGVKVEVGYLNQFIGQRNGRVYEFNNTVFFAIISNRPLSKLW